MLDEYVRRMFWVSLSFGILLPAEEVTEELLAENLWTETDAEGGICDGG